MTNSDFAPELEPLGKFMPIEQEGLLLSATHAIPDNPLVLETLGELYEILKAFSQLYEEISKEREQFGKVKNAKKKFDVSQALMVQVYKKCVCVTNLLGNPIPVEACMN